MIRNIEDKFLSAGLDCFIEFDWGRIYVKTDDLEKGIRILRSVFGITSVSPVIISNDNIKDISKTVLSLANHLIQPAQSFALRTRRTGQHSYTSIELAQQIGKMVLEKNKDKKIRVDLTKPDIELFIEVRNKRSYIFSQSFSGPGGLPLGTQGKILSIFSDDNSYVAAWLMMKRGCRVYPVTFLVDEKTQKIQVQGYKKQLEFLKPWAPNLKLKIFNFKEFDPINTELLKFVKWVNAKGICFSYNLENFINNSTIEKSNLPYFYPLIGLDEDYIERIKKIIKDA